MADPLISVIVPVYKVEPWLERCVESIRNQTYRNLEILLVDDGSPDRCGEICDRLAREDDRIKVIHRENGGLSAARNSGLDVCRGEYIGCVDSDDLIHPEMYARLYADLVAYGTKLAFCQPLVCYDANISFPPMDAKVACFTKNELLQKSLVDIIWFSAWTKLYHRDLFEGIRYPEGRINEDYPVTIRLFDKCDRIAVDFNPLYAYCKRTGSITASASCRSAFDQIINAEEVASYIKETHPDLQDHADFILLSSCLGFLLKTDVAPAEGWKEKRKDVFALIRKHFPEERHNSRLSFSQKALLAAASAGAGPYRAASWLYRTLKRR